jgi:hypothetical protein
VERAVPNAKSEGVAQMFLVLEPPLQNGEHRVLVEIFDLPAIQPTALPGPRRPADFFPPYVAKELSDPRLHG